MAHFKLESLEKSLQVNEFAGERSLELASVKRAEAEVKKDQHRRSRTQFERLLQRWIELLAIEVLDGETPLQAVNRHADCLRKEGKSFRKEVKLATKLKENGLNEKSKDWYSIQNVLSFFRDEGLIVGQGKEARFTVTSLELGNPPETVDILGFYPQGLTGYRVSIRPRGKRGKVVGLTEVYEAYKLAHLDVKNHKKKKAKGDSSRE